jgi:hypothetical protein
MGISLIVPPPPNPSMQLKTIRQESWLIRFPASIAFLQPEFLEARHQGDRGASLPGGANSMLEGTARYAIHKTTSRRDGSYLICRHGPVAV